MIYEKDDIITTQNFRKESILFKGTGNENELRVIWYIDDYKSYVLQYQLGFLKLNKELSMQQLMLATRKYVEAVEFHKAIIDTVNKYKGSEDKIEADFMLNFLEDYQYFIEANYPMLMLDLEYTPITFKGKRIR